MLAYNLLQFTRCSFRQKYKSVAAKDIVDQFIMAVVCKLHFSYMRACTSAHVQHDESFPLLQTKPSLYGT